MHIASHISLQQLGVYSLQPKIPKLSLIRVAASVWSSPASVPRGHFSEFPCQFNMEAACILGQI